MDNRHKRRRLCVASQVQQGISPENTQEEHVGRATFFDHGSVNLTDEDPATDLEIGSSTFQTAEYPDFDTTTQFTGELLHFVDKSTIVLLYERMNSARLRWSNDGEAITVSPRQTRLDFRLVAALFAADQSICQPSKVLTAQRVEALECVCFAFPRIKSQEPDFASLVNSLHPLLNHLLQCVTKEDLSASLANEVAEVLLAATKVKRMLLQSVANYLDMPS
jgi:hypothetical protein